MTAHFLGGGQKRGMGGRMHGIHEQRVHQLHAVGCRGMQLGFLCIDDGLSLASSFVQWRSWAPDVAAGRMKTEGAETEGEGRSKKEGTGERKSK